MGDPFKFKEIPEAAKVPKEVLDALKALKPTKALDIYAQTPERMAIVLVKNTKTNEQQLVQIVPKDVGGTGTALLKFGKDKVKIDVHELMSGYTWEGNSALIAVIVNGKDLQFSFHLSKFKPQSQGDYEITYVGASVPQSQTEKSQAVIQVKDKNGYSKGIFPIAPGETKTVNIDGKPYKVTCGRVVSDEQWAMSAAQITVGPTSGTIEKAGHLDVSGYKFGLVDTTVPMGPDSTYGGIFEVKIGKYAHGLAKASPASDYKVTTSNPDSNKKYNIEIIMPEPGIAGLTWAGVYATNLTIIVNGQETTVGALKKGDKVELNGVTITFVDVANP